MSTYERGCKRPALHDSNTATNDSSSTIKSYGADSPLPSVAMRIRKAVSEGYNNGQATNFAANYQRVPLPATLNNQPPSLSSSDSTRTVSNLEEWDSYYKINNTPIQTIDEFSSKGFGFNDNNPLKRKFQDAGGQTGEPEIAQFQARYGELKFNEEF
ncbi:DIF1 [Candida margitis]|uniref:DIF1 n=1 Tax=Candida margitis TaxID=1775924 RepID=UPI00222674E5|nr:DIF1 [Candida margitis]KAI5970484.1 DIF1 [Candida margitis]